MDDVLAVTTATTDAVASLGVVANAAAILESAGFTKGAHAVGAAGAEAFVEGRAAARGRRAGARRGRGRRRGNRAAATGAEDVGVGRDAAVPGNVVIPLVTHDAERTPSTERNPVGIILDTVVTSVPNRNTLVGADSARIADGLTPFTNRGVDTDLSTMRLEGIDQFAEPLAVGVEIRRVPTSA